MEKVIDINGSGCVTKRCKFVFKINGNNVCIRNPPVPVPIPQQNPITGEMNITINPVFTPCVLDAICGEYVENTLKLDS